MENKQIIKAAIAGFIVLVLSMFLIAGAIVLPHTDRDIHGHYRVVDTNHR